MIDLRHDIAAHLYHSGPPDRARAAWQSLCDRASAEPVFLEARESWLGQADRILALFDLRAAEREADRSSAPIST